MRPDLSSEEVLRYSRHLSLPGVGLQGQRKLKNASVLIVGVGGLGSPAALYLAAAGVGRIGLIDYDWVSYSNLQRQILFDQSQVGKLKVEQARARLLGLNGDIEVIAHPEVFSSKNALELSRQYDILLDGSDNFATRYLANDVCVLQGKPYVYGAVYRFDGQVGVFDARQGACYRCLFPEPPAPGTTPSCAEGGVLGVLPGLIGTLQALETVKLITGAGTPAVNRLLMVDGLTFRFDLIDLRKNPACKICGAQPEIRELMDTASFCGEPLPKIDASINDSWEISPAQLAEEIINGRPIRLIDVRTPEEVEIAVLAGSQLVPHDQIAHHLDDWGRDEDLVLYCRGGVRSLWALRILREAGFEKARHLAGGILAWAREIDPTMKEY